MKTQVEQVKSLIKLRRDCINNIKDIVDNYNIGFLSIGEYISQLHIVTVNFYKAEYLIEPYDTDRLVELNAISNFLECNNIDL